MVKVLEYSNFNIIKTLRENRETIYYSTRYKQMPESDRSAFEREMAENPALENILKGLKEVDDEEDLTKTENDRKAAKLAKKRKQEADDKDNWAQNRKILDLEDMAFTQGSHFMANKKCHLPEGSYRKQKKSYEVVYVPPLKPKPFDENEKLIPIEELPKWARPGFKGFKSLNRIQSAISKKALKSNDNLLICAPTVSFYILE